MMNYGLKAKRYLLIPIFIKSPFAHKCTRKQRARHERRNPDQRGGKEH